MSDLEAARTTLAGRLRFAEPLEAIFQDNVRSYHERNIRKLLIPSIVLYNAFLVADLLVLPATFVMACVLHAVVTAITLGGILFYRRTRLQSMRDLVGCLLPLAMFAQILAVYWFNRDDPAAEHYQYLATTVVVYMNINLRMGFRTAAAWTLVLALAYLAVMLVGPASVEARFTGACVMISAAYISLMANRRMERDVRFNFLRRQRDKLLHREADDASKMDALTGLSNRRHLDEVVESIWHDRTGDEFEVGVIMVDIDHFKLFNDRYGHQQGDICLKRAAAVIASQMRGESDLAVRMGGEELLLLLPGLDLAGSLRVGERLRRAIQEMAIPHENASPDTVVTASIGVTAGRTAAHDFKELVASADAALYAAKQAGRNRVWPPFVNRAGEVVSMPRRSGKTADRNKTANSPG